MAATTVGGVLTAAALVPPTPLLVPGAAGRAVVLEAERTAALEAVRRLVASGPDVVVVLSADGPGTDAPGRATLAGAGVPDAMLGWSPEERPGAVVTHVPSAVGLLLLERAGWHGRTVLRPAGSSADAPDREGPFALLVTAGGSVRRGDGAPLPADTRAAAADAALLGWLRASCAGPCPVDPGTAAELGMDLWAPAQELAGSLGRARDHCGVTADVLLSDPFGAAYLVGTWTVTR